MAELTIGQGIKFLEAKLMQSRWSSDDLGTTCCSIRDVSLVDAMNYIYREISPGYEIAAIEQKREFWWFGKVVEITIWMENPKKIAELKGTQHYSKSMNPTRNI